MFNIGALITAAIAAGCSYLAYEWFSGSSKVSSVVVLALNYLARPHQFQGSEFFHRELRVASAWNGTYLSAHPEIWIDVLEDVDKKSLQNAVRHFVELNKSMSLMVREDFPVGANLSEKIAKWEYQLKPSGRGFQVIRGFPVSEWTVAEAEVCFFGLGIHLGIPGAQDVQGSLLGHVKDVGPSKVVERPYRQHANIGYHCDGSDVVGLMCLHSSKEGGSSRIISSTTLYNEFLKLPNGQRMVKRLFDRVLIFTRKTFGMATHLPMFPFRQGADGVLRTYWNEEFYMKAYRNDDGSLTAMGVEEERQHPDNSAIDAIAAYDALMADDTARQTRNRQRQADRLNTHRGAGDLGVDEEEVELGLEMFLQQGDVQLVTNHFVLHARTEFEDYTTEELCDMNHCANDTSHHETISMFGKRDLLRLWLSHSHADMPWDLYLSKQSDLCRVLWNLAEGMWKYT